MISNSSGPLSWSLKGEEKVAEEENMGKSMQALGSSKGDPSSSTLFFYLFCLHWVFAALQGLCLVAASGGCSSVQRLGFSLWASLAAGPQALGALALVAAPSRFSSYSSQVLKYGL